MILKGKAVTRKIYDKIKSGLADQQRQPKLAVLVIGYDPASDFYVKNLQKNGKKNGIKVEVINLSSEISQDDFIKEIERFNIDPGTDAVMLQKPFPEHFDDEYIAEKINPEKDVDAFHPVNMGNLVLDKPGFIPCTAAAVLEILDYYEIETSGKNVVVLGRSNIVGKPLANLLLRKNKTGNATVTVCHSRTENLPSCIRKADILIAAIGQPEFVKGDWIKEGTVVIDVGINLKEDEEGSRYTGDVLYDECEGKSGAITPVPGGVGSVTSAMLLMNVYKAFKNRAEKE
ncbi:MAG: bifunctional 5,10-methylene-tetrahydrofolate dehydrogenase/5,10-methylene-tetrahydrofolate cyclohydrolase [Candidatus Cloacimonadota bacterium]|nr:MAG: bifunctional 5,10-methylene-tetrahydrofolate dehydrogenase/5,10-methylene-tetrahydrofolate cyclohydrolase [Candidatus Cloacimonadota bacterium]